MSVKLRFDSPGSSIQRSRSFTGFGSLTGRRRPSSARNSLRSKVASGGKTPRAPLAPRRGFGSVWSLQPEEVDRVFQALRKGLREHVQRHQAEMDFLSSRQRECKRNSRLAFLYDLDKEIRAQERHVRRLEFQISKVDELYENYCVQWRLCQGVVNMKRAFSLSPSSRASRESLLELGRNHRHSVQDMSAMEGELEVLLGELHVKMKGLIGFARLCPGDQYEVLLQLGRQRWRIRGRIESDDVQSWDEEEKVFLPHINHNFEIKVSEAKGLGWLLVGTVTCTSAHFFVASPQLMVVDITELGTIKLQLEVTWNPLDSAERAGPLSISKQWGSSRKTSVHSWTAPSTPSFSEKYFLSMVRELQDGGASVPFHASKRERGDVSLLSYLSQSSITSNLSQPSPDPLSRDTSLGGSRTHVSLGEEGEDTTKERKRLGEEEEAWEGVYAAQSKRSSVMDLQRCGTPDILKASTDPQLETQGAEPRQDTSSEQEPSPASPQGATPPSAATEGQSGTQEQALRLGMLIVDLERTLQNQSSYEKQLRVLNQQIVHLATILRNDLSLMRSSSSEDTLAVEEVLGSFDFLSHDVSVDEDASGVTSLRRPCEEELLVAPLTCGNCGLDQALEIHLNTCCILLQTLQRSHLSAAQRDLLEDVSLQADIVQRISCLLLEKKDDLSTRELLQEAPKEVLLFWEDCLSDITSPFCCRSADFVTALRSHYSHKVKAKVKAKQPGHSERVFSGLVQEVQAASRAALWPPQPPCSPDKVSVFQLSLYLRRCNIRTLGEHVSRLSKEEYFLSAMRGPKRRRALNRMRGRGIAELLPLGPTLQTLAALQLDANHKVCKAAADFLRRAAGCSAFRSKAVVYYTESLRSTDVQIQQSSCLALKWLMATESVDHIAELWWSADEDVRSAAKEAVLSFGGKGHEAFQRMEHLDMLMQEEFYQNLETEITVL
ncbi:RIPOR family member 3 [Dunckerocampus dactyliophorus]|uniref:RIPOR family member 3 n=1 Tax=Dunckerocampus dactyliophorus TaxID=161453 RepID=UPI0024074381|nr:RIPOR family member 3 [Dunckerocampus dactyliophorus]